MNDTVQKAVRLKETYLPPPDPVGGESETTVRAMRRKIKSFMAGQGSGDEFVITVLAIVSVVFVVAEVRIEKGCREWITEK